MIDRLTANDPRFRDARSSAWRSRGKDRANAPGRTRTRTGSERAIVASSAQYLYATREDEGRRAAFIWKAFGLVSSMSVRPSVLSRVFL